MLSAGKRVGCRPVSLLLCSLNFVPECVVMPFQKQGLRAASQVTSFTCRVRHKHFLRAAADLARGSNRQHATKLAMRFVQVCIPHFPRKLPLWSPLLAGKPALYNSLRC
jgi:hypothetical protein